ncbi:NAD(P)/FAD-dependent oxidoreductase [Peterkaempfera bronchialis]|uniref:FAD-dependent oxidoreductase n=1 Tax=Peterkaempfera bronchialis TaxID=2126346 RepID=A0A345SUJ1_9ACTN|nr:FAD-dependent oxidoreductase [Peterkaempfera bronchialis]AXI77396.1 FAD-dependent oxidoreductase [Peterkaempfera bronchialis]
MTSTAPATSPTFVNGDVSFWYREGGLPARRPALPGDLDVDVALVGGGLTGLWTAYYLKQAQPDLRIAVLEKEFAGFGASGRNGGWLSAEPPGQMHRYAKAHGWPAAVAMQREMFSSVDEVIRVAAAEGIEADIRKDGLLHVATNAAQQQRLRDRLPSLRAEGWGEDDLVELDADQLAERVRVAGARSAQWSPHCARIQPAKLVRGLADVVERMGVAIYEGTEVTEIRPGEAVTRLGTVRATNVIRALEGFTAGLRGSHRDWLPMNSSMIVTEPLEQSVWDEIGWRGAELIGDEANSYCYIQRTTDGRIAIGGRGIPYMYGSHVDQRGETRTATQLQLQAILRQHFPATRNTAIDHTWSGVLGVPRDWCATVHLDQRTGLGWAGGYVGHGVTTTNLAGRTLRDLILRQDTDLVRLPWVGRRVRGWEPEPLRWLGVRSLYVAYRAADRHENSGLARTSAIARLANVISGR